MKMHIWKPPTNEVTDHNWTLVISWTCVQRCVPKFLVLISFHTNQMPWKLLFIVTGTPHSRSSDYVSWTREKHYSKHKPLLITWWVYVARLPPPLPPPLRPLSVTTCLTKNRNWTRAVRSFYWLSLPFRNLSQCFLFFIIFRELTNQTACISQTNRLAHQSEQTIFFILTKLNFSCTCTCT